MYLTAGWRRCCFRSELRKRKSADDVVMTMMCEEGNILAYWVVYLEMWRPWAPVHVIRRTRDGPDMSSVGVDGADGMRSHIVGAMSSKPGMASCGTFAWSILLMTEDKRRDKRRYLNAGMKKKVSIVYTVRALWP